MQSVRAVPSACPSAEQAQEATKREFRKSGLLYCRNIWSCGRTLLIRDSKDLDFARLGGAEHGSHRHHGDMDAPLREVRHRVRRIVVGYECCFNAGALLESQISEIWRSRHRIEIEAGRLLTRESHEI